MEFAGLSSGVPFMELRITEAEQERASAIKQLPAGPGSVGADVPGSCLSEKWGCALLEGPW